MKVRQDRRAAVIVGIAAGGLLAGHWLTYLIGEPHTSRRAEMLAATGHGYLGTAAQVAAIVAAISLAVVFLSRLTGHDHGLSLPTMTARLAVVQGSAFVAMETLERLGSGAGLHDLVVIVPLGMVVQAVVAFVGARLLRWVLLAADTIASGNHSLLPPIPRPAMALPSGSAAVMLHAWRRSSTPRAPPAVRLDS